MSLIYPIHYHYRGRWGSDKGFILARMAHITPEKQQEVSDEYEKLYHRQGRDAANNWLDAEYLKCKTERTPDAYNRHLEKMKTMVEKPMQKVKKVPTSSGVVNTSPLPGGVKGIQFDW